MRGLLIILILTFGGVLTLIFLSKEKNKPSEIVNTPITFTAQPATPTQNSENEATKPIPPQYNFLNLEKLGEKCLKLFKKGHFSELIQNIDNDRCDSALLSENERLLVKAMTASAMDDKVQEAQILLTLLNKNDLEQEIVNNKEKILCHFVDIAQGSIKYEEIKKIIFSSSNLDCISKKTIVEAGDYFYNNEKFEEARRLYSKVYFLLEKGEQKEVYKKLTQINNKMIFSATIYSDSFTYTVVKGDILMKIGKKFSINPELIKKINKLKSDLIYPGQNLKILKVDKDRKFHILVKKDDLKLYLLWGEDLIREYPISIGNPDESPTPSGQFRITSRLPFPTWKGIPYGDPANILGTRWLGFNEPHSNYGIHGTTQPDTIGKKTTNGCIRMHNSDIEELYDFVTEGVEVVIK
ncbi:MAG: L,D-transpeptidase family protein [Planctomycetota bacterium]